MLWSTFLFLQVVMTVPKGVSQANSVINSKSDWSSQPAHSDLTGQIKNLVSHINCMVTVF